jgi:hypothetical protein
MPRQKSLDIPYTTQQLHRGARHSVTLKIEDIETQLKSAASVITTLQSQLQSLKALVPLVECPFLVSTPSISENVGKEVESGG